jgi:hypothetical protein
MTLTRKIAVTAVAAAAALPAPAALALPQEGPSPQTGSEPATQQAAPAPEAASGASAPVVQDLRSPDAREVAVHSSASTAPVSNTSGNDFPWLEVGLGTGFALILAASAATVTRRRHRIAGTA